MMDETSVCLSHFQPPSFPKLKIHVKDLFLIANLWIIPSRGDIFSNQVTDNFTSKSFLIFFFFFLLGGWTYCIKPPGDPLWHFKGKTKLLFQFTNKKYPYTTSAIPHFQLTQ